MSSSPQMIPCMGGYCQRRELCQHYRSESDAVPSESLCARTRQDWFLAIAPEQPKEPLNA